MKRNSIIIICAAVVLAALLVFLFVRQNKTIKSGRAEAESLRTELSESRESEALLKDQIFDSNQEMSAILNELAGISGRTSSLKMELETGSASISQAQQIEKSIDAIKERIDALEKANSKASRSNKEFQTVIENFKKVVTEQEKQIGSLKAEIAEKNATIADQKNTIDNQLKTIGDQKKSLQDMVKEQAKALYNAGADLEAIADDAPSVSWRKNKQKVAEMSQALYRKAMEYYQKAFDAGYEPAGEAVVAVKEKITGSL